MLKVFNDSVEKDVALMEEINNQNLPNKNK